MCKIFLIRAFKGLTIPKRYIINVVDSRHSVKNMYNPRHAEKNIVDFINWKNVDIHVRSEIYL